jgi:hypothetical protein
MCEQCVSKRTLDRYDRLLHLFNTLAHSGANGKAANIVGEDLYLAISAGGYGCTHYLHLADAIGRSGRHRAEQMFHRVATVGRLARSELDVLIGVMLRSQREEVLEPYAPVDDLPFDLKVGPFLSATMHEVAVQFAGGPGAVFVQRLEVEQHIPEDELRFDTVVVTAVREKIEISGICMDAAPQPSKRARRDSDSDEEIDTLETSLEKILAEAGYWSADPSHTDLVNESRVQEGVVDPSICLDNEKQISFGRLKVLLSFIRGHACKHSRYTYTTIP